MLQQLTLLRRTPNSAQTLYDTFFAFFARFAFGASFFRSGFRFNLVRRISKAIGSRFFAFGFDAAFFLLEELDEDEDELSRA